MNMSMANVLGTSVLETTLGVFLDSSGSLPHSYTLRGVNLGSSSKFPNYHGSRPTRPESDRSSRKSRDEHRDVIAGVHTILDEEAAGFYSIAEKGGEDGWFVGRPLEEDLADVHLRRLRSWGYNIIRLVVTWEGLEHAGPGHYDEQYIDYLIRLLKTCKANGFRVYVSPHEDVFSRFVGGSGAPYWILEAFGLCPRRIHQTGSAVIHCEWAKNGWGGEEGAKEAASGECGDYPDMIWNTNGDRLAARHCSTMLFASKQFAPKCKIDGLPAGEWARNHFNNAFGHLADRIREAGGLLDECLIGWDSLNEPDGGFIGIPDLREIPPTHQFRKGPSPTPQQGFQLGVGKSQSGIAYDDFGSLGHKKLRNVTLTPPKGQGVWLTREESKAAQKRWGYEWSPEWDFWDETGDKGCPWAGHGVWDRETGSIKEPDYFYRYTTAEPDFMQDFWRPYYAAFVGRIRIAHPQSISLIHPAIFDSPPHLSETTKQGRMALSSHFYDGLTMLGKRRHLFNASAVHMQRGLTSMIGGAKIGEKAIRQGLRDQFAELKSDSRKEEGMAESSGTKSEYPTIIGELGAPWDMKPTGYLGLAKGKKHQRDYREPAKSWDELLNGCDGKNALSYTIWVYEPRNCYELGDRWCGEDLSLFSYDELDDDLDLSADNPQCLRDLILLGSRGIEAWCRPYVVSVTGQLKYIDFNMTTSEFFVTIESGGLLANASEGAETINNPSDKQGTALIYLPYVHYLAKSNSDSSDDPKRIIGRPAADDAEWTKGSGPAVLNVIIQEISEGRLDIEGQWATWTFPLEPQNRTLNLKLKRYGDKLVL